VNVYYTLYVQFKPDDPGHRWYLPQIFKTYREAEVAKDKVVSERKVSSWRIEQTVVLAEGVEK
jgi:hypothetical protein